jgi:outer membrane protein TolC
MIRTISRYGIVLFILSWSIMWSARAEIVLTLDRSVEIALEQNPQYLIAQKELSKAKSDVWQAYAAILPKLDGSANFQRNWKIQESTIPNFIKTMLGPSAPPGMPDFVRIAFGLENTFQYGAMVTQPLFLGGAGIAGIKASYAAKTATAHTLEATRQNLILLTVSAFYSCLLARELLLVQESALAQEQANMEMVQTKYEVGSASGFDRMRARVEMANRQPQVIGARNDYQLALTSLKNVLGLKPENEIRLEGAFLFEEDAIDSLTLEELQAMASQNRPELLALHQQKIMTKEGIAIARSNFMPKLFFSTDYSFMAMRNDLKFSQDDFSEGFTSALSLQIPLFNGFKNTKQYQKAKLEYKIMQDIEKQLQDGIFAEVEKSYHKFNEAKEKYFAASESIELGKEALRLANLMYEEGTNTQLDVLSSQLALTQASMNYASSIFDYKLARYQLRKAIGTLNGVL